MSFKVRKNSVSIRDEATQVLFPIGMLAAGSDESLRDFKRYTEKTVESTVNKMEVKKTNSLQDIPDDYSELGNRVTLINNTYLTEYKLGETTDFDYIENYHVSMTGVYNEVSDKKIKWFDKSDYFRIADSAETITFQNVDNTNSRIDIKTYLRFYDKNLNPIGNGCSDEDITITGFTKINVLNSNNIHLSSDARYVKMGFIDYKNDVKIKETQNLIPVRLFPVSEYNKYIKVRLDSFNLIKGIKKFIPSDEGQTIIDNFTTIEGHKYIVSIKSSSLISSNEGYVMFGIDDNSRTATDKELYNGISMIITAKNTTEFSRVFISVDYSRLCIYDENTIITASIKDISNTENIDTLVTKSDLDDINNVNNNLDYFRHNGLLPISNSIFKWKIGSLSSDGEYIENKLGIVSEFMSIGDKLSFISSETSMITIFIYNENKVFEKYIQYDLKAENNYRVDYSFSNNKMHRIVFCTGKNGQSTSNITTEDDFNATISYLSVFYTDAIAKEGYMLTTKGDGSTKWAKAVKDAVIDTTLTKSGECAEAKATGDAVKNLSKYLNDNTEALKKSVSDGKTLVATAITSKGVATENTDSFEVMANNIGSIKSGGTTSKTLKVSFEKCLAVSRDNIITKKEGS